MACLGMGCSGQIDGDKGAAPDGGLVPVGSPSTVAPESSTTEWPEADAGGMGLPGSSITPPSSGGGEPPGGELPVPVPPGGVVPDCGQAELAEAPLLKLSTVEYRNTVRDLLRAVGLAELTEVSLLAAGSVPDDSRNAIFLGLDDRVSLEHVEGYLNVARAVGGTLRDEPQLLEAVFGRCAVEETLSDACADDFFDKFARRAYRRPLTEAERGELLALGDRDTDAAQTLRDMIIVTMMSPRFVNHVQVDGALQDHTDEVLQLSPYEVASRLSYTFWQTMPDDELFEAAEDGSLTGPAGVERQLQRILRDPRARETLWSFWREWLGLDGFTGFEASRPGFQALAADLDLEHDYYADMVQEVRSLVETLTFERNVTLSEMLTTNVSVTSSRQLAALYGVEPWGGEGDYPELPPSTRSGLFQRAALLVSSLEQTNPFHRGAFLKKQLLCENLPSPDPAALPPGSLELPPTDGLQTTRERFAAKIDGNGLCTGCHALFTESGYALEAFDSLGRYRETEHVFDEQTGELLGEVSVDSTARIRIGSLERQVTTPAELTQLIVDSQRAEDCLVQRYLAFTYRRPLQAASTDACVQQRLVQAVNDPVVGLLGAFQRVAEDASFYQRKVGAR